VQLIGRHPECDIRITMPQVSRRHCCLALAYDRVIIRDLGSRNGLRVNGRLVDEAQIYPGDEVAIGAVLYRLEGLDPTAPEPTVIHPAASPPQASSLPSLSDLPGTPAASNSDLVPLDDD
jgi:pSer/pThr/pTyr-binding forkhead associated (FHA) protein